MSKIWFDQMVGQVPVELDHGQRWVHPKDASDAVRVEVDGPVYSIIRIAGADEAFPEIRGSQFECCVWLREHGYKEAPAELPARPTEEQVASVISDLLVDIYSAQQTSGLSLRALSRASGVAVNAISEGLRGERALDMRTIVRLALTLGHRIELTPRPTR